MLPNEMTQRCKMLAVLASTSNDLHKSHQSGPKIHHLFMTSWTTEKGITIAPTRQSAAANDATK